MYLIKVGSLYLGQDGSLTPRQSEALRVTRLDSSNLSPRFVKLRYTRTASNDRSVSPDDLGL
jgi:hypothetical protein